MTFEGRFVLYVILVEPYVDWNLNCLKTSLITLKCSAVTHRTQIRIKISITMRSINIKQFLFILLKIRNNFVGIQGLISRLNGYTSQSSSKSKSLSH